MWTRDLVHDILRSAQLRKENGGERVRVSEKRSNETKTVVPIGPISMYLGEKV
jgi:hypothetical protein